MFHIVLNCLCATAIRLHMTSALFFFLLPFANSILPSDCSSSVFNSSETEILRLLSHSACKTERILISLSVKLLERFAHGLHVVVHLCEQGH